MRVRVFLLTYIAYCMMHSLRTGYSYSKTYFKVQYDFSPTFLAVLDSSIYLAMGVGLFLRYFFLDKKDVIFTYFTTGMTFIVAFALFPFLSIIGALDKGSAEWVSIILMVIYGFFQMNYWPVSFVVMTDYFTNEEDGCLIGVWVSSMGLGNILGYFFSSLFILNLHEPWQIPILIQALITLFCTLFVYIFVKRPIKARDQGYLELQSGKTEEANFSKLLQTFSEIFSSLDTTLLLLIACVFKAITYTFALWLPIMIDSRGEKSESLWLSVIFNISNMVGASAFGKFYESSNQNNYKLLQYVSVVMSILIVAGMVVMVKMETYSFFQYTILIILQGFVVGGLFSIFTSNQLIKLAKNDSVRVDLFSTAIYSASTFTVGIAQLMIGVFMIGSQYGSDYKSQSNSYGEVLTVLTILVTVSFVMISIRSYNILFGQSNMAQIAQ